MIDDQTASLEPVPPVVPFPWPPREGDSALEAFVTTWRESVFHPTSFFSRLPDDEGYGATVLYYLIVGVIAAGVRLFWRSVLPMTGIQMAVLHAIGFNQALPRTNALVDFLFSPIVLIIVLYLSAGLTHLCLMLVRGAHKGFDTTTRVCAFSYGPVLFTVVPMLGSLAALIGVIVMTTIGLREAHHTTTGKSLAAIFLPYLVLAVGVFLLALIVVVFGVLLAKV